MVLVYLGLLDLLYYLELLEDLLVLVYLGLLDLLERLVLPYYLETLVDL